MDYRHYMRWFKSETWRSMWHFVGWYDVFRHVEITLCSCPFSLFLADVKILALHFFFTKDLDKIWDNVDSDTAKLHDMETSSPASTMTLLMAVSKLQTRHLKSLSKSRSERTRMASLVYVEKGNISIFVQFSFWTDNSLWKFNAVEGWRGKILTSEVHSTSYSQEHDRDFIFICPSAMSNETRDGRSALGGSYRNKRSSFQWIST